MKCNLWNRIDAGLTFVITLEWSRLFVAPIFNLFDKTLISHTSRDASDRSHNFAGYVINTAGLEDMGCR